MPRGVPTEMEAAIVQDLVNKHKMMKAMETVRTGDGDPSHGDPSHGDPSQLLMKDWLIHHLDRETISGLKWHNKKHQEFVIPWKHGSTQGWNEKKDSKLYRLWREHKGRSINESDTTKWKAAFRSAINKQNNIQFCSKRKDCKVYKFTKKASVKRLKRSTLNSNDDNYRQHSKDMVACVSSSLDNTPQCSSSGVHLCVTNSTQVNGEDPVCADRTVSRETTATDKGCKFLNDFQTDLSSDLNLLAIQGSDSILQTPSPDAAVNISAGFDHSAYRNEPYNSNYTTVVQTFVTAPSDVASEYSATQFDNSIMCPSVQQQVDPLPSGVAVSQPNDCELIAQSGNCDLSSFHKEAQVNPSYYEPVTMSSACAYACSQEKLDGSMSTMKTISANEQDGFMSTSMGTTSGYEPNGLLSIPTRTTSSLVMAMQYRIIGSTITTSN